MTNNLLGELLAALLRAPDYTPQAQQEPKRQSPRQSTWRVMSAADLPREGRHFTCGDDCGCTPAAGLRYRPKGDGEA
ncbi:hypothetical protein [Bradyrhizobium sp. 2TAF24]|uniref:hypothetical protein n=1 Tax=Bradyrhizobium sp. 2TAF24 TaxID=3233011 RepID=UPI003F915D6B